MKPTIPFDLIISDLKKEITSSARQELDVWLEEGRNREIYTELELLWNDLRERASIHEPDLRRRWQELSNRLSLSDSSHRNRRKTTPLRLWKKIGIAAAVAVAAFGGYFISGVFTDKTPASAVLYSSLTGKSKMYLPDGSLVWIHNNTTLSYDTRFGDKVRNVTVEGEAYFEVVRNDKVPFVVNTGEVEVKVLGTKFNVRNREYEETISVSLLDGSVSVGSGGQATVLEPGFEALYFKDGALKEVSQADLDYATNWAAESLRFTGSSLEYVACHLSRWYDISIVVDPGTRELGSSYNFTVRDEPLEEIMRLLSRVNPITYHFDETNTLYINVK